MIHFHVIIGKVPNRKAACEQNANYSRVWRKRLGVCECLEHVFAQAWLEATGFTSWVVDVRPVLGAFGAAAYLAKYLTKAYVGDQRDTHPQSKKLAQQ